MSSRPADPIVEAAAKGRFVGAKIRRLKPRKRRRHDRIRAPPPSDALAYSIPQFCSAFAGMSEALYYKIAAAGQGPKTFKVGNRTMISIASAKEWLHDREEVERETTV
jgi:predicted DNA-binding transcriptional regulator AlpA